MTCNLLLYWTSPNKIALKLHLSRHQITFAFGTTYVASLYLSTYVVSRSHTVFCAERYRLVMISGPREMVLVLFTGLHDWD